VDNAFEDLGNKIEVGNWTIAGEVIGRKVVLLEDGSDESVFEGGRERSRKERKVYDSGDRMEKGREAGFQEPGGDRVEGTSGVGGGQNSSRDFRGRSRCETGKEGWGRRRGDVGIRGGDRRGEKGS
jgi:hypothetical protein